MMTLHPPVVVSLPKKDILTFLRDPKCIAELGAWDVNSLFREKGFFENVSKDDTDIELLFEQYQHYDPRFMIYDTIYDLENPFPPPLLMRLLNKYVDKIQFKHFPLYLLDQDSVMFTHKDDSTLTISGKFKKHDEMQPSFKQDCHLMEEIVFNRTLIPYLALQLSPNLFCKMLEAIPLDRRTYCLFHIESQYDLDYGYYAYVDRLQRQHPDNRTEDTQKLSSLIELLPLHAKILVALNYGIHRDPQTYLVPIPKTLVDISERIVEHVRTLERQQSKYSETSQQYHLIQQKIHIFTKGLQNHFCTTTSTDPIQILNAYFDNAAHQTVLNQKLHRYDLEKSSSLTLFETLKIDLGYVMQNTTPHVVPVLHVDKNPFSFATRQSKPKRFAERLRVAPLWHHIRGSFFIQKIKDLFRTFYGLLDAGEKPVNYPVKTYRMGLVDYLLLGIPFLIRYWIDKYHLFSKNQPLTLRVLLLSGVVGILYAVFIPLKILLSILLSVIAFPIVGVIHIISCIKKCDQIRDDYAFVCPEVNKSLKDVVEGVSVWERLSTTEDHPITVKPDQLHILSHNTHLLIQERVYCYGKMFSRKDDQFILSDPAYRALHLLNLSDN